MPITVAIDARLVGGSSTGDSTYWTGLLDGLFRLNSGIRYLLFSNAAKPSGIPDSPNFEWIYIPGGSRWWSLVQFPFAARKAGANVLHTQYSLSPLVGAHGVTTIHDVSFFVEPKWFRPKDRFLLRNSVPNAARRARKVITVSNTSKSEIESFIPCSRGKTVAIYNAAGLGIRSVPRQEAQRRVQEIGIEGQFLLTIGTRWPRKNLNLAMETAEDLPYQLAITGKAGWGDFEPRKHSKMTGYVDDETLSCLYCAADLYLAPSWHEGFGVPVLEAFRCGCPVVSSAGGALPEVVGEAGMVMRSWDPADWATEIRGLLLDSSKLSAMREAGAIREREFSWTRSAREHEAVYREVANGRP